MSRADFEVRRYERYGHVYECTPYGEWLKDGKPFKPQIEKDDREGTSGVFWVFDGSAGIAPVTDFGFLSNTDPRSYEQIGSTKDDVPEGKLMRTRCIKRTAAGMECYDNMMLFEKDGVTLKKDWIEHNAPFVAIGDKAKK